VIAGVNVIAADSDAEAQDQLRTVSRFRVARFLGGDRDFTDDEADEILASPQGRQIAQMMHYSAVGDPATVDEYLGRFAEHADADELIVVHSAPTLEARLHSLDLVAEVSNLAPA
jgi:alkanesulfonate monooxygenase SsuD/methylene tetrahydromethanopterin reductase-like flavin-dependent oxidoreductase (luciferase family)